MTDYFALLNEPRLPWMDEDLLKKKFLDLSSQAHPDRVHQSSKSMQEEVGARYLELNTAYNCLRDPKCRLRHLLELESGKKPADVQNIPPELVDFAFEIGRSCKATDALLEEKNKASSAILRIQFFERGQQFTEKLQALQRKINERRDVLITELKLSNNAWESDGKTQTLSRIEEIYRLLGYFTRWTEQIQERIVELSL
jgi:DnaJ-domain-containing protein 1